MSLNLTKADGAKVADAIRAAEARTDGEIQAVVSAASDTYADVVLHYALIVALLPLAILSAFPHLIDRLLGDWGEQPSLRLVLTTVLIATAVVFLIARLLFGIGSVRMALTPHATRARRVRRRAILLFKAGVEKRTLSTTGVLLYLSLAERRAEIVADSAIHAKVDDREWGEAMVALLTAVRDGRPGDGIASAVAKIGDVLATHFPRTGTDPNELPDRLITL